MKRVIALFIPCIYIALMLGSCTDDGDKSQPRTMCGIGLYNRSTYAKQNVDSLTVKIVGVDSVLYSEYSGNTLSIPLRYVGNTSVFELRRGDRMPDTLTVVHKNTPRFISMDAGYAMYYELLEVSSTQHAIDTITITNTMINTNEQENISIYYPEY